MKIPCAMADPKTMILNIYETWADRMLVRVWAKSRANMNYVWCKIVTGPAETLLPLAGAAAAAAAAAAAPAAAVAA